MFHYQIVVESRIIECTSLKELRQLLYLRTFCKEMISRIPMETLKELIQNLVRRIGSFSFPPQPINDVWQNCQLFLSEIDRMGRLIQGTPLMQHQCIIAGSFALCFYMRLHGMKCFKPNDLDLYTTKTESSVIEEFYNRRFRTETDSNYYNTKYTQREAVLEWLYERRKWNKYDWDTLLQELPERKQAVIYPVDSSKRLDTHEGFPINLVVSLAPWNCRDCFTMNVLTQFDMKQCAIAITHMHGTFYPEFIYSEGTHNCIIRREIGFSRFAFLKKRAQLERVKKYMDRGFGLITNPNKIVRL